MSPVEIALIGILGPIDLVFLALVWRHRNAIDRMLSANINRWLVARHKPEDIGEPGQPQPYCFTCRKPWPCKEWDKLHAAKTVPGVEW